MDIKDKKTQKVLENLSSHLNSLSSTSKEGKELFLEKMKGFKNMVKLGMSQKKGIQWSKASKITPGAKMISLSSIKKKFSVSSLKESQELLKKVFILKLNGGLGTNMGVSGPKALVHVKKGNLKITFLEIIIKQVSHINKKYKTNVPIVLMNSFYTNEDISKYLKKVNSNVRIFTFCQKMYPKLIEESMLPFGDHKIEHWYPPGHGDIYDSLLKSDVYDKLIADGRDVMFLSNIDNLRSTIDLEFIKYFVENKMEFCMEVTQKTASDVKGESVVQIDNRLKIIEMYMVPKDREEELLPKLSVFNTNNIWVKLSAIPKKIDQIRKCNVIFNRKVLEGKKIVQLEQACAAAIRCFEKSCCILVTRKRFLPVKKNCDLFLIRSSLYNVNHESGYFFKVNEDTNPPIITLTGKKLNDVNTFDKLILQIPDISELKELHLKGNVMLDVGMKLSGVIKIEAEENVEGGRIEKIK